MRSLQFIAHRERTRRIQYKRYISSSNQIESKIKNGQRTGKMRSTNRALTIRLLFAANFSNYGNGFVRIFTFCLANEHRTLKSESE